MIIYLVAATEAQGIKDAEARGWTRIGRSRFATPEKHDIRLVFRIDDVIVMPGGTPMIKASDYDVGPPSAAAMNRWAETTPGGGDRLCFDRFVADGNGRWVGMP